MKKQLFLLVGTMLAYFVPEAQDSLVGYIAVLFEHVTYDSIWAWGVMLMRRFLFKSVPWYVGTWFLRPLAPRWVRKFVDVLASKVGEYVRQSWKWFAAKSRLLTSTPIRIATSLSFAIVVFAFIYYKYGHTVVIVVGFWPFVKPYVLYGLSSGQDIMFRTLAFFGVQKIVPPMLHRLPKEAYKLTYTWLHITYMFALRKMIKVRFTLGRILLREKLPANEYDYKSHWWL